MSDLPPMIESDLDVAPKGPSIWERANGLVQTTKGLALDYGRPMLKYGWLPFVFVLGMTDLVEGPAFNFFTHLGADPSQQQRMPQ